MGAVSARHRKATGCPPSRSTTTSSSPMRSPSTSRKGASSARVFRRPEAQAVILSGSFFHGPHPRHPALHPLLVEEDVSPLLGYAARPEQSRLYGSMPRSSTPTPSPEALRLSEWYEEGKIHATHAQTWCARMSEVIIANMLVERGIPFRYEVPRDVRRMARSTYPISAIRWRGEAWYWEHLGSLDREEYRNHWETKRGVVRSELSGATSDHRRDRRAQHGSRHADPSTLRVAHGPDTILPAQAHCAFRTAILTATSSIKRHPG